LHLKSNLSDRIQQAVFGDEVIEKLEKQLAADKKELQALAADLSANRAKAIPQIESSVLQTLAEMGMGNSALKIEQKEMAELSADGVDQIKFLFSANKGHALAE